MSVAWRQENGAFFLDVELPPNTSAEVWMPAADERNVREGGAGLESAPGVRFLEERKRQRGARRRVGALRFLVADGCAAR